MHKLVEIVESNRRGFYGDEKTQKLVDKLACMTDIQPQFHLATPALCVSQKDNTQKQSNNLPSVQGYSLYCSVCIQFNRVQVHIITHYLTCTENYRLRRLSQRSERKR